MLLCLSLTSCKEEPWLEVTTGYANAHYHRTSANGVTITTEQVNFRANFQWQGDIDQPLPQAFGGVYYGKTNNLSVTNNLGSTKQIEIGKGYYSFSESYNFDLVDINMSPKDETIKDLFAPGDTMYYRAYAKVINGANDTSYIYGEEKFIVMDGE